MGGERLKAGAGAQDLGASESKRVRGLAWRKVCAGFEAAAAQWEGLGDGCRD
jgi:hypothetical protein